MKFVFKVVFAVLLLTASLAGQGDARAEGTYFTTKGILKDFFPRSEKVSFERVTPTAAQRAELKKKLGYELAQKQYIFYVAKTGGRIDGYAFIDDQLGQHLPITFAVKLAPDGSVARQEIMVYRESRGDEVRDARFRKQFIGKTAADLIRANKDIDCVSGATISSHAVANGVRRAVLLFDIAVAPGKTGIAAIKTN